MKLKAPERELERGSRRDCVALERQSRAALCNWRWKDLLDLRMMGRCETLSSRRTIDVDNDEFGR